MRLFLISLFMACLVNTSYGIMDCPPRITNGKLYGILPVVNQNVLYSEVIDCGAVSQADLFRRVRLWTAQACYSPGDSFSLSDKETGDLVGRMSQVVVMPRSANSAGGVYTVQYSLVIECTNRKYRATITHLDVQESGARSIPIEGYCQKNEMDIQALYSTLDGQLRNQLVSLQEGVKNYKPF